MRVKPKKPKISRHDKAIKKANDKLTRMRAKAKLDKAKDKIKEQKAMSKAKVAQAQYTRKSMKKYGMNDAEITKFDRMERIKTRESGKKEFQKAVAHNMKYGGLYNSINNTVEEIFDYPGWNIVNDTEVKGK